MISCPSSFWPSLRQSLPPLLQRSHRSHQIDYQELFQWFYLFCLRNLRNPSFSFQLWPLLCPLFGTIPLVLSFLVPSFVLLFHSPELILLQRSCLRWSYLFYFLFFSYLGLPLDSCLINSFIRNSKTFHFHALPLL